MAIIDLPAATTTKATGEAKPAAGRAGDPVIIELCEQVNRVMSSPAKTRRPVAAA